MAERELLRKCIAYPILGVIAVVFLPIVVPAAVSRNYRGIANRLAAVPGIRRGGGSTAALAVLAYLTVGTVLLLGTASASLGSGPLAAGNSGGGASTPATTTTATPTSTATATATPTVTTTVPTTTVPTPTPTVTATPTATPTTTTDQSMQRFKTIFRQQLNDKILVDIPVVALSARGDGSLVLLYDAVSINKNATKMREQWYDISFAYGAAIYRFTRYDNTGRAPWRLKVIEWNASSVGPEGSFHVETSDAQRYLKGELSGEEYNVRWFTTIHAVDNNERELAWNIFENKTGRQVSRNATLPKKMISE